MKRFLPCRPIMRTPQRLAIDGYHPLDGLTDPLNPLYKTGFKLLGIKAGKDATKGVVGGYPIEQVEQVGEPGFFRFPEFFNFYPSLRSADHSTNRHNDDIPQSMEFGSVHAGIFHLSEDAFQISQFVVFHPIVSSCLDRILSPPHI